MSLRRSLLTAALVSTTFLSACMLRPHYRDVVQPGAAETTAGQTVALRVIDTSTNQPVKGAKVLAGEGRSRLSATSDAEGLVTLEVSKDLLRENPLVEVVLPAGVSGYRLQLMPSGQAPAPEPTPAAPEMPTTPETPALPETPATPSTPSTPATPETPTTSGPSAGT